MIEAMIFKKRGDPAAHFDRARELSQRGDHRGAIKEFDRAIKLRPEVPEAYLERGLAHARLGELEAAAINFGWAIDLGRAEPLPPTQLMIDAHFNCGLAQEKLGNYGEAEHHYDSAIDLYPDHGKAWCNKGNVLLQVSRFQEAADCHTKALDLNPSDYRACWGRAIAHKELGRLDLAVDDLTRYIEIAPTNDPDVDLARRLIPKYRAQLEG